MGNWKKKKGNIGRNKQRRYNRRSGKVENFNQRNRRAEPQPDNSDEKHHQARGFIPEVKERTFRHCTCEGMDLTLKNQRLLELLRKEPRGFDATSGAANVLVISQRFRRNHARHMKHFVAFLREQNICYR
jgi:hypothetical protein